MATQPTQPQPPRLTYTVILPSLHAGWWERARLTLSAKEFRRLIADVATGKRQIPALIYETVEVDA